MRKVTEGRLVLTPIRCSTRRKQHLTPLKEKPKKDDLIDVLELNSVIDETGALPEHITIVE